MTRLHFKLSQISLALALAFGALIFTACGADESKAPQIAQRAGEIYVISQDDDTIIKGITVSGRNGKCERQTIECTNLFNLPSIHKDMEARIKYCDGRGLGDECKQQCKPIFDGQKLPYNEPKGIYKIDSEKCPPKNGVYRVELETNFGTYEYELKEN